MADPRRRTAARRRRRRAPARRRSARLRAGKVGGNAARAAAAAGSGDGAAKRAKTAGATGARLSGVKKHLRDSMICARRAEGWEWARIAQEARVDQRTCKRVVADAAEAPSALDVDPMNWIAGLVHAFQRSIGDYQAMALAYADSNPPTALGALRQADETRMRLTQLLLNTGSLPRNLRTYRSEEELHRLAEFMAELLLRVQAGHLGIDEAIAEFREIARGRSLPKLAA